MENIGNFRGHKITVGIEPVSILPPIMLQMRQLREFSVPGWNPVGSIEDEEERITRQDHEPSVRLSFNRHKVYETLRAAVHSVYESHGLPRQNLLDVGSGGTGWMAHEMLKELGFYGEVELNPDAVREHKKRRPGANIISESYLELSELGIPRSDVVTGLSSLDATFNIGLAVRQIRDHLKTGGYLFHVQDVIPGGQIPNQWMLNMGYKFPFRVLRTSAGFDMHYAVGETWVSTIEIFRRVLGQTISFTDGMEVVFNDWVTAETIEQVERPAIYYSGAALQLDALDPSKPKGVSMASCVVTVARKI